MLVRTVTRPAPWCHAASFLEVIATSGVFSMGSPAPMLEVIRPLLGFVRERTLGLLDSIEKMPDPPAVLGWRPGPGRAHIGWQLLHVAVTEELFATERLAPHKPGRWTELWPRFRGGSTPDDEIPSPALIREVLDGSRARLLETLAEIPESLLDEIPAALAQRKISYRGAMNILVWHESHHHGQAHITLNLHRAAHAAS
jgi:hypothetical protein